MNVLVKKCKKCGVEKSIGFFSIRNKHTGLFHARCDGCRREHHVNYCKENRERIKISRHEAYLRNINITREYERRNRERIRQRSKEHYLKNKVMVGLKVKKYASENTEKIRLYGKKYRESNKERCRTRSREYARKHKLRKNVSSQMYQALKSNKGGVSWQILAGYSIQELKTHLEGLFRKGMTWKNYGRNGWHVDHVIPKSYFVYTTPKDDGFKRCWALSNLQPLWENENQVKYNKLPLGFNKEMVLAG